jgi:hypothetical protein
VALGLTGFEPGQTQASVISVFKETIYGHSGFSTASYRRNRVMKMKGGLAGSDGTFEKRVLQTISR